MKISLARPAWKANIHSNVYVSGLPLDYTEDQILSFFLDYKSQIENIRKLRDSRGIFRGIAVIRFDNEEIAHEAIKRMSGLVIIEGSAPIQVRPWRPEFRPERIDSSFAGGSSSLGKLNSLSPTPSPCTSNGLTTPSPTGYNKLDFDHQTNQSMISSCCSSLSPPQPVEGWQEIWSKYVESQMKQMLHSNEACVRHSSLPIIAAPSVSIAQSPTASVPSLFVFHLPADATESTLRVLFEPYGNLISVRVLPGKGYGFVNFEHVQGAIAAVNGLNGYKIGNKHLKVEFKKPTPLASPSPRINTPIAVTVPTKI
jgi:RNA recognition motif-containing protein